MVIYDKINLISYAMEYQHLNSATGNVHIVYANIKCIFNTSYIINFEVLDI